VDVVQPDQPLTTIVGGGLPKVRFVGMVNTVEAGQQQGVDRSKTPGRRPEGGNRRCSGAQFLIGQRLDEQGGVADPPVHVQIMDDAIAIPPEVAALIMGADGFPADRLVSFPGCR